MRLIKYFSFIFIFYLIIGCDEGGAPSAGIVHPDTLYVDIISTIDALHTGEIILFVTEEQLGKWIDLEVIDPDDPADALIIDPNGDYGDDNGYLGGEDEYLPADEATLHSSREDAYYGEFPIEEIKITGGRVSFWIRVYPDKEGTYHPGDNYEIKGELRGEDATAYTPTFYTWKKMRIEYDYFTGCELPDTSWWVIEKVYSGEDLIGNYDPSRNPYVEFKNDKEHLLKDNEISEDIYLPDPSVPTNIATWYNNVREKIRNTYRDYWDTGRWPFYLVAADSIDTTGCAILGHAYWPFRDPNVAYPDSTNMVSLIYVKKCEEWEDLGYTGLTGVVTAHELGHFIAYLKDYNIEPWEHSSQSCLMNTQQGFNNLLADPRFCSKCIYHIRGNPRKRGPLVFKRR